MSTSTPTHNLNLSPKGMHSALLRTLLSNTIRVDANHFQYDFMVSFFARGGLSPEALLRHLQRHSLPRPISLFGTIKYCLCLLGTVVFVEFAGVQMCWRHKVGNEGNCIIILKHLRGASNGSTRGSCTVLALSVRWPARWMRRKDACT